MMPSRVRQHTNPDGTLAVECWCRTEVVFATPKEIMAGVTRSCGRKWCHREDA